MTSPAVSSGAVARVIALGQAAAGDDGAALHLMNALEARLTPSERKRVELVTATDASQLVDLLRTPHPVWILDAVVGADAPGQVLTLSLAELAATPACSVSSHGLDVRQAVELCHTLYPEQRSPELRIVAISIEAPRAYRHGLSAQVHAAVERCTETLLAELQSSCSAAL